MCSFLAAQLNLWTVSQLASGIEGARRVWSLLLVGAITKAKAGEPEVAQTICGEFLSQNALPEGGGVGRYVSLPRGRSYEHGDGALA